MANKEYNPFNEFEDIQLKNAPSVVPKVLKEMKKPLTEFIDGQSVTKDSLDLLKTDNINLEPINASNNMENTLTGQGNTQNRQRVLTREMPGGTNMKTNNSQPSTDNVYNNYGNINNSDYSSNASSNVSNSMWGFTDTAILLSIAVLIALVFLVSTAAIMYFGLK